MEGKLTSPDAQHSSSIRDMQRTRFHQARLLLAGTRTADEKFCRGSSGSLVQFNIDGLAVDVQLSSSLTNVELEWAIRHMKMRTDEVCSMCQLFHLNRLFRVNNFATLSAPPGFQYQRLRMGRSQNEGIS
jgi:hypothetical protein